MRAAARATAAAATHAHARVVDRTRDVLTCVVSADAGARPGLRARVTVDRAPQAAWRFSRAVVETGQANLGGTRRQLPQQLHGVGAGADWVPARRELLATAGDRLVTVTILGAPAGGSSAARSAAVALARSALR